jgi:hypothetical protein
MPRYLIERDLPDAGQLTSAQLQEIARKSCSVIRDLADVHWLESLVTADRIYCVYVAPNEDRIREHARRGGFPATRILPIAARLDPSNGE